MMSGVSGVSSGCALFSLTPDASLELNEYLSIRKIPYHVPLNDIASCSHIPDAWNTYLNVDVPTLTGIFKGKEFNFSYPRYPHSMLLCDPTPTVFVRPIHSIYGNRMFMTSHNSPWFDFLIQFAADFEGETLTKLHVYTLEDSLPPHILDKFVAKAQALVNVSMFGNANTSEIVDAVFKNIDQILSQKIFQTTGLALQAFGIVLQLTSVIHSPNIFSVSSLIFNLLKDCAVEFVLIHQVIDFLTPYFNEFVAKVKEFVNRPVAQNGVGDVINSINEYINPEGICNIFSVISVAVITAVAAKKLPDKSTVNSAMRFASTLGRAITGATGAVAVLSAVAMPLYDKIYEFVVGVPRICPDYLAWRLRLLILFLLLINYIRKNWIHMKA